MTYNVENNKKKEGETNDERKKKIEKQRIDVTH